MLLRPTLPALRGVVDVLWISGETNGDGTLDDRTPGRRELVLPDGRMHLAIRLGGRALRLQTSAGGSLQTLADSTVAGPYTRAYLKDSSHPGPSIGAIFHAGAAQALFGCEPAELVNGHWPLEQFWCRDAARLRDQVNSEREPLRWLRSLEDLLAARMRHAHGLHPQVAQSLQDVRRGIPVGELVAASGYSHRRFLDLFRRATGMSPKHYARLSRFQRALRLASGHSPWIEVALAAGYSDQAHLIREFREFSDLTPQTYRKSMTARRRHVPLRVSP